MQQSRAFSLVREVALKGCWFLTMNEFKRESERIGTGIFRMTRSFLYKEKQREDKICEHHTDNYKQIKSYLMVQLD
jgi:hypothetical protein